MEASTTFKVDLFHIEGPKINAIGSAFQTVIERYPGDVERVLLAIRFPVKEVSNGPHFLKRPRVSVTTMFYSKVSNVDCLHSGVWSYGCDV